MTAPKTRAGASEPTLEGYSDATTGTPRASGMPASPSVPGAPPAPGTEGLTTRAEPTLPGLGAHTEGRAEPWPAKTTTGPAPATQTKAGGPQGRHPGPPAFPRPPRTLSLGAGVQSSALYLLACDDPRLRFDAAIFADTGWEPAAVYEHLDRLEAAGDIPIYRVSSGHIRHDALDPEHRFASMPLFVKNKDGSDGMARRQCTSEYKLKPIKVKVRELLGFPHPTPVPKGVHAEVAIGISTDEIGRARDSDVRYMRNVFPLLDLGWSRKDCESYLRSIGWGSVSKSACIGCPYHGNRQWRLMRDEQPEEWDDAVEFDAEIRNGSARANAAGAPLRGQMYLHRSRVPLSEASIDRVTSAEWKGRQGDLFDEFEEGDADGCSPWTCRSGRPAP